MLSLFVEKIYDFSGKSYGNREQGSNYPLPITHYPLPIT